MTVRRIPVPDPMAPKKSAKIVKKPMQPLVAEEVKQENNSGAMESISNWFKNVFTACG